MVTKYATADNPNIEAAIHSLFRFKELEQAVQRLEAIKKFFVKSRKHPKPDNPNSVIMWIRDFAITEEEKKQGYLGNYAIIAVVQMEDKKYTLQATKIESELKHHPRRKRPKRKMPNFGHPVLRDIKKGRVHAEAEGALGELEKLHEEFPEVSIPAKGKLYIMIYAKAKNPKDRVKKYVLEVEVQEDGGFKILLKPNEYQKKELPHLRKETDETEKEKPTGKFTSMVALGRKTRKRKPPTEKLPENPDANAE